MSLRRWAFDYFSLPYGATVRMGVTVAGGALIQVCGGLFMIMTLYGSIAFWQYQQDANIMTNGSCQTSYQCILMGIQWGFRGDLRGSWGPPVSKKFPEYIYEDNSAMFEWVIVTTYHVIFRFVFTGIITATICMAFNKVVGAANAKAADERARCMICSIDRFTLENKAGGFFFHTDKHHNPWMYLGYLSALKLGDPDEFTGLESYVDSLVLQNSMEFFPVGSCTAMEAGKVEAKKVTGGNAEIVESINSKHKELRGKLKSGSATLNGDLDRIEAMLAQVSQAPLHSYLACLSELGR